MYVRMHCLYSVQSGHTTGSRIGLGYRLAGGVSAKRWLHDTTGPVAWTGRQLRMPPPTRNACVGPLQDFQNATHWPKHLLVHYTWETQHEENEDAGLLVLFSGAGGR